MEKHAAQIQQRNRGSVFEREIDTDTPSARADGECHYALDASSITFKSTWAKDLVQLFYKNPSCTLFHIDILQTKTVGNIEGTVIIMLKMIIVKILHSCI